MPVNYNQEMFKKAVKKVVNEELLKGWKLGMQSVSKTILKRLEGLNEENYKDKVADVIQFCEWTLKDDKTKENIDKENDT